MFSNFVLVFRSLISKTKKTSFRYDLSAEMQIIPVVRGTPPIDRFIA
jgi:hypothetical protein